MASEPRLGPDGTAFGERLVDVIAHSGLSCAIEEVHVLVSVVASTIAAAANAEVNDVPLDDRDSHFRQTGLRFFGFAQLAFAEAMQDMLARGAVGQPAEGEDPEEWLANSLKAARDAAA